VEFGLLNDQPRMPEDAYSRLREINRRRTGISDTGGPHDNTVRGEGFTVKFDPGSNRTEAPLRSHEFRVTDQPQNDPTAPSEDW
jgi:hypothetical protein